MVELDFEIKNKILNYLRTTDSGASASDIAKEISHNRITIGKYLQILEAQKLVISKKIASAIYWQLAESHDKSKVLIVDDEKHIVDLIRLSLDNNYTTYEAYDGQEAIIAAQKIMPDIIILDVMMPKKDGFEVCDFIKSNVLTQKIPVLMLSAKGSVEDKVKAMNLGADDYMVKPFDPLELEARISRLIRQNNSSYHKNSITNLPNKLLTEETKHFWDKKSKWFETIITINEFDEFVKEAGHKQGSEVIKIISRMLVDDTTKEEYIGHIDDESFAIFSEKPLNLSSTVVDKFQSMTPYFYTKKDIKSRISLNIKEVKHA